MSQLVEQPPAAGWQAEGVGNATATTTARRDEAQSPAGKRQRTISSGNDWLRQWAWKREHRPDRVRFDRPYLHPMSLGGEEVKLTIHQQRFKQEGFASTVWDSSIVLAKYFERHSHRFAGRRCLDLSAGCGLPGVVLARLGACVTATDLAPNLPLLKKNAAANGCDIDVQEHSWGGEVASLAPPYDVIAACDVMYIGEVVQPLLASLAALAGPETEVYLAHGRNRQAEPAFLRAAAVQFSIEAVPRSQLDEVYQCADVDVLHLKLKPRPAGSTSPQRQQQEAEQQEQPSGEGGNNEDRAPEPVLIQGGNA